MKHTELPYELKDLRLYKNNILIANLDSGLINAKANAELIVRACNSYYELLEACEKAYLRLPDESESDKRVLEMVRQIINKAKDKE